jgi:hypothetical protein
MDGNNKNNDTKTNKVDNNKTHQVMSKIINFHSDNIQNSKKTKEDIQKIVNDLIPNTTQSLRKKITDIFYDLENAKNNSKEEVHYK